MANGFSLVVWLSVTALLDYYSCVDGNGATGTLPSRPNVVLIYGDDVGYGDLNCYGHPTSRTPRLDAMARQGTRLLQFYSAAPLCSPSRASLLTGRLYPRTGVYAANKAAYAGTGLGVFDPDSEGGMLLSELTLAQALKPLGYMTGMVGKWHLGIGEGGKFLPHQRGFDSYFGLPMTQSSCHSNAGVLPSGDRGPCPIMRNSTIIQQPGDILHTDASYVQFAKEFMTRYQDRPFFLYFASHHTHRPQFAALPIVGSTRRGIFGDSLAELDWSVGELLDHVQELDLHSRTLVIFSSDNGPELKDGNNGGEQGPLKCGKGTTWEGGVREPAIFWWPGVIPAGTASQALGSTLDVFPTVVKLAGGSLPTDRQIDGYDLMPVLQNPMSNLTVRDNMLYYSGSVLMAARLGAYKLHYWTEGSHCNSTYPDSDCWSETGLQYQNPPLLFNVERDPKERHRLNASQKTLSSIVKEINSFVSEHNKTMTFGHPQLDLGEDKMLFPCCNPQCTPRPNCCTCGNKI